MKNGKTLKDWTRETRDSITQPLSEMMSRGDPYGKNEKKFLASDFSETRRVASTDPLEVTYQKSALNSKELAGDCWGLLGLT